MSIPRGSRSRSREPMSSAAAPNLEVEEVDYDAHVETHMVHFANQHSLVLPAVTPADRPRDVQDRWHGWFTHLVDQQGYRQPPRLVSTQPLQHRDLYHFFDLSVHLPPYLRHGLSIRTFWPDGINFPKLMKILVMIGPKRWTDSEWPGTMTNLVLCQFAASFGHLTSMSSLSWSTSTSSAWHMHGSLHAMNEFHPLPSTTTTLLDGTPTTFSAPLPLQSTVSFTTFNHYDHLVCSHHIKDDTPLGQIYAV